MKYKYKKSEEINPPEIQSLLARHCEIYEKYWFRPLKSPSSCDAELSRILERTVFDFEAEYVIDDCIAVMRKVNFHIVDWSRDVEGDVEAESELPHIRLSAVMLFPHFADDRDAIEKIYNRRMEFPHDGIEENYKWARLLDAEDGLVLYNYQLAEDIDERLLEDEIKFMFEFTDRRMKKIGFLRTS